MSRDKLKIGIGLLGKGSTNHLHRKEVVERLMADGFEPVFLVREDYFDLLDRQPGCDYVPVVVIPLTGWKKTLCDWLSQIRRSHPSKDPGRKVNLPDMAGMSWFGRLSLRISFLLARFRTCVNVVNWIDEKLRADIQIAGLEDLSVDVFLLLGIGTVNSELETDLTRLARRRGVPVVHYIGNFDNLSSKGYRGVDVERILVWGPSMRSDAISLQGIRSDRVTTVGSIRYNYISEIIEEGDSFLRGIGLDPVRKTIMFGGFVFEFAYFEMLEVWRRLSAERDDLQMIFRPYPNKSLLAGPAMSAIIGYAKTLPSLHISMADPNYKHGSREHEVLEIEEYELMNSIKHSDVIVNQFSTLSLEACLFDKPAVNMWYFGEANRGMRIQPQPLDFPNLFHSRRMSSYEAVPVAANRTELVELIDSALEKPTERASQRAEVREKEIGIVDGKAMERVVAACRAECDCKTGNALKR